MTSQVSVCSEQGKDCDSMVVARRGSLIREVKIDMLSPTKLLDRHLEIDVEVPQEAHSPPLLVIKYEGVAVPRKASNLV